MAGGVATILFTDIVRSTELQVTLGDDDYDDVRRAHFALVRDVLASHHGQEVKTIGDGFMAVFERPSDGVSCAVALQQSVERHNARSPQSRLSIRVGLQAGEVTEEGGDYFGTPVVVASRLCARAEGGEILCSELIRALVGSRGGHTFKPVGVLDLKGIDEPTPACVVEWEALPTGLPLPAVLANVDRPPHVGRAAELTDLRGEWQRVLDGERRLVLISGEPGIGKTHLATELAIDAAASGATVLYGRCDEDAVAPYQPFVEALRHYLVHAADDELRDTVGDGAAPLARLVPELSRRLSTAGEVADPETERFRMFEAAASVLAVASHRAPVLLVLDDLHWADKPTLLLLRHLLRGTVGARMLILGTYRDTDLDRRHPLADALADLRREHGMRRVDLSGLTHDEVVALLEARAEHEMTAAGVALAEVLRAETEGNPLFLWEILRHLIETGVLYQRDGQWMSDATSTEDLAIPQGVKDAIGRRLSRLSSDANTVLAAAAVLGRDFDAGSLGRMLDLDEDAMLRGLDEAVSAQLVSEVSAAEASYSFTHALVRQSLYDELTAARRQRLHRRALDALEGLPGGGPSRASALAMHAQQAGGSVEPERTIRYTILAGTVAAGLLAWEEAFTHWDAARELMEEHESPLVERARLLQMLGDVSYVSGVGHAQGMQTLEAALALYEQAGAEERAAQIRSRLARDKVTFVDLYDVQGAVAHIEAAAPVLEAGPARPAQAHFFTARASLYMCLDHELGLADSLRAMQLGEQLGRRDIWANAAALGGAHSFATARVDDGYRLMQEAWEVADAVNAPFAAFVSAWLSSMWAGNLGDPRWSIDLVEQELAKPRVAQAPLPRQVLAEVLAFNYIHMGDFATARRLLSETKPVAAPTAPTALQLEVLTEDPSACVERLAEVGMPPVPGNHLRGMWSASQRALIAAMSGDPATAVIMLEPYAELAFAAKADALGAAFLAPFLVDAELRRGDVGAAEAWGQRMRTVDADLRGSEANRLGAEAQLAAARGRPEEAEAMFDKAIGTTRRYGIRLITATLLFDWGRVMRPFDPAKAVRRLDESRAEMLEIGYSRWWLDKVASERERAVNA